MLEHLLGCIESSEDHRFDLIYPPEIRALSNTHWTPVTVARLAAEFLVREPGTRVLDVGCGPGKFCVVGALTTKGRFTGVEQRKHLSDVARATIERAHIPNVEIIDGNIMELNFSEFDAFYLYNPFWENRFPTENIDTSVALAGRFYEQYTEHVATQLLLAPVGTRVATYFGICEEIPIGYERKESSSHNDLKFWEKTGDGLGASSSSSQVARAARKRSLL